MKRYRKARHPRARTEGSGANRKVVMLLSNPASNDPRVRKEADALVLRGYEVRIVAWDRRGEHPPMESGHGFRIDRIGIPSSYGEGLHQVPALFRFCLAAARRIARIRPDIIHCHDVEMLPLGFALSRAISCRLVFDAHEPDYFADARRFRYLMTTVGGWIEKLLGTRSDAVLVTTEYQLTKFSRFPEGTVHLVPNYPEPTIFRGGTTTEPKPLTVGRIGALYHDMGIEELVRAYAILRSEFPELRLVLAGQTTGEYGAVLKRLVSGAGGNIDLKGGYRYDDLFDLYGEIDVCVIPTKVSPWFRNIAPTKFFEALGFGKPVVTTDIGGIGRIVRNEECGGVLETVDSDSIASHLRPLLRSRKVREEMGRRGARAIREKYSWNESAAALLDAYTGLNRADEKEAHRVG